MTPDGRIKFRLWPFRPGGEVSFGDNKSKFIETPFLYLLVPMYYDYPNRWLEIVKNGMRDIIPRFDSNRMAKEYYELLYNM